MAILLTQTRGETPICLPAHLNYRDIPTVCRDISACSGILEGIVDRSDVPPVQSGTGMKYVPQVQRRRRVKKQARCVDYFLEDP